MRKFPNKPVWKVLTFRMRVRTTEFEVLTDALAGTLENEARMTHGCAVDKPVTARIDGKLLPLSFHLDKGKR